MPWLASFQDVVVPRARLEKKFYMPSTDWKIPLIQDTKRLLKGK